MLRIQIALIAVWLVGCKPATAPSTSAPVVPTTTTSLGSHGVTAVGAPVPAGAAVAITDVLASPDRFAGKELLVEGHVRAACSKRGCWMELAGKDAAAPACRVRFKDYGFFVPTNSAGADARLAGVVSVRSLAKDEVAHFESEGATIPKAADGSAKVVEITATGVELMRM